MAQGLFPITTYQLADTTPVANGYLIINLSKDATASTGPIGSKIKVKVLLDANGKITGAPQFWPNQQLSPSDSVYIVVVYNSQAERIAGPLNVVVVPTATGFGLAFGSSFGS